MVILLFVWVVVGERGENVKHVVKKKKFKYFHQSAKKRKKYLNV
jgi:hypothetical protein